MTTFNFCAGPAMLPVEVMQQAQQEFINWQQLGCSVMEISHRSKPFIALAAQAEQDLRDFGGGERNPAEAEEARDQRDDEKYSCPVKHDGFLSLLRV